MSQTLLKSGGHLSQNTCRRTGLTQSSVIEDALAVYFSVSIHHERDAALIERQDAMLRQLARIEREQNAVIEIADMIAFYQLVFAPPMTPDQKAAARERGRTRHDMFRDQLKDRLNSGRKLLGEALADAQFSEDDFVTPNQHHVAAQ
jgi:hypothetical protein